MVKGRIAITFTDWDTESTSFVTVVIQKEQHRTHLAALNFTPVRVTRDKQVYYSFT
jgi:hypothetical protein